ncbi:RibD family protein [Roseomonas sp. NAR14]|uniref:RibD family protein n=1 Tax=Roseomonas acroporae TaxID=2937791 RepID=A0A9X1YAZ3_9PROT|nr:RibD family protein [Roseomonas acroporae]MCK8783181.1 RibD family protein [Roseomonas acroporae]
MPRRTGEPIPRAGEFGATPRDAPPWLDAADPLFAPLLAPPRAPDGCFVLGRLAQTLDGRIATESGNSQWIGGAGDILHTHRLRALCHAVVVGAGTVRHDDPRLTTRAVAGPNPVRVVLDTECHLPPARRVFADGPPTLLACAEDARRAAAHGTAELLPLPRAGSGLCLPTLLRRLAARGLTRIMVEGGGVTVSRFLAAGCLDRLHVTVAPLLLGSGRPAFTLPPALHVADGLRLRWRVFPLDAADDMATGGTAGDLLFDIALDRACPAA